MASESEDYWPSDPRVRLVYEMLCDTAEPPEEHHWEGWLAERIVAALSPSPPEGFVLVAREPTEEMIDACESALAEWRKTLSRDEAMARSYQAHDRKFIASATPREKHRIRYRAMIAASPTPLEGGDERNQEISSSVADSGGTASPKSDNHNQSEKD